MELMFALSLPSNRMSNASRFCCSRVLLSYATVVLIGVSFLNKWSSINVKFTVAIIVNCGSSSGFFVRTAGVTSSWSVSIGDARVSCCFFLVNASPGLSVLSAVVAFAWFVVFSTVCRVVVVSSFAVVLVDCTDRFSVDVFFHIIVFSFNGPTFVSVVV